VCEVADQVQLSQEGEVEYRIYEVVRSAVND
jgi:hypothetical protein